MRQQRDELKVKIHLANMEVQEEWDELEVQWQQLVSKKDNLGKDLAPTISDAHTAWLLLKDDIAEGYRTIRDRL